MGKRQTDDSENADEETTPVKKAKLSTGRKSPDKKPDWMKYKEKKKELKVERKKHKCLYSTSVEAKQIWEKYRQRDCKPAAKAELGNKLHKLLQGHYQQAVLSHDLGRIIQWLIKLGNIEMQQDIAKEIRSNYVETCKSKYGSYTIRKLLKSGIRKLKDEIIDSLMGNVIKLMSHKIAAPIVSNAYELYATSIQKCFIRQEFYGDMHRLSKDPNLTSLKRVLDPCQNLRKAVIGATKANLMKVINKNLANSALLNDVLAEFITLAEEEDRAEVIAAIKGFLPEMAKTKEGARVGRVCVWYGTQKDRKAIIKSFKGSVGEVAMSEHGSLLLMAIFDCVDDTVLVQKAIISEIIANISEISMDKHGRKVVQYLVAPRDPLYFHPAVVQLLAEGDKNPYSKKSADMRRQELLAYVIDPLLTSVAENIAEWVADASIAIVTLAILKAGTGIKLKAPFETLAQYICNNGVADETEAEPESVVESPGVHFLLKKLILADKITNWKHEVFFSKILVNRLDAGAINRLILSNRGCFMLIMLLETGIDDCVEAVKRLMTEDICECLKKKTFKGSEILLMKLKE